MAVNDLNVEVKNKDNKDKQTNVRGGQVCFLCKIHCVWNIPWNCARHLLKNVTTQRAVKIDASLVATLEDLKLKFVLLTRWISFREEVFTEEVIYMYNKKQIQDFRSNMMATTASQHSHSMIHNFCRNHWNPPEVRQNSAAFTEEDSPVMYCFLQYLA